MMRQGTTSVNCGSFILENPEEKRLAIQMQAKSNMCYKSFYGFQLLGAMSV